MCWITNSLRDKQIESITVHHKQNVSVHELCNKRFTQKYITSLLEVELSCIALVTLVFLFCFKNLQNLKFLDVSRNKLLSAKLGSKPQLPSLVNLNLGFNDFTALKKDDFSFLNHSSFLQVLNLSSVSLKSVRNLKWENGNCKWSSQN